jgi:hypothetical protein
MLLQNFIKLFLQRLLRVQFSARKSSKKAMDGKTNNFADPTLINHDAPKSTKSKNREKKIRMISARANANAPMPTSRRPKADCSNGWRKAMRRTTSNIPNAQKRANAALNKTMARRNVCELYPGSAGYRPARSQRQGMGWLHASMGNGSICYFLRCPKRLRFHQRQLGQPTSQAELRRGINCTSDILPDLGGFTLVGKDRATRVRQNFKRLLPTLKGRS